LPVDFQIPEMGSRVLEEEGNDPDRAIPVLGDMDLRDILAFRLRII
jgi:hypothetical protein